MTNCFRVHKRGYFVVYLNKLQNNTGVSTETVRHESTYIILFLTWHNKSINDDKNNDLLQWRHNGHYSVSNHQPHHCLFNGLFRCRSKKTSKLRVTGLWAGNSPGTGEFPAQMTSNAENVSIWWPHHIYTSSPCLTHSVFVLLMMLQLIAYDVTMTDTCDTLMWIKLSNSLRYWFYSRRYSRLVV